jgi:hypothetical protein
MSTGADTEVMPNYERFQILLDDPSDKPQLGFGVYADAFAQVIEHSRPRFAVGIFGDWGSGKTTLMRAIERRIVNKPDIMLPVWFNAWRYEKEEHLIVPLLDNLREALLRWSALHGDEAESARLAKAAALFGRAARTLLRGLSITGGVPGVSATLSFERLLEAPRTDEGPSSFYHAAFRDMQQATADFVDGPGDRRIVVFVDDLDRCLPANALQVLESMKLFFDERGFVFVVGLDQTVIERSIETKYEAGGSAAAARLVIEQAPAAAGGNGGGTERRPDGPHAAAPAGAERRAPISGADYIKKIFQLPFALPRIGTNQLNEFLDALRAVPGLPTDQGHDLDRTVKPHLVYMTDRESLNPREVKRLINAYTLQMKLLQPRLRASTSASTVLSIQLMSFRPDWTRLYDVLLDDPDVFVEEMRHARDHAGTESALLGDSREPVPQAFLAYVRGPASDLLDQPSLLPYISSAEQTRTTDPGYRDARKAVRRLQGLFRTAARDERLEDPSAALTELSALRESFTKSTSFSGVRQEVMAEVTALEREVKSITDSQSEGSIAELTNRCVRILARIEDALQEIRRQANLAGTI